MRKKPYSNTELFQLLIASMKEEGNLPENLLDYTLEASEVFSIMNYEFDMYNQLNYGGNEGIYLTLFLQGDNLDGNGTSKIHLGTLKTLLESDEAMLKMAELNGHCILKLHKFVNENLDDFTWTGFDINVYENGKRGFGYECATLERAKARAEQMKKTHPDVRIRDNKTRITKSYNSK